MRHLLAAFALCLALACTACDPVEDLESDFEGVWSVTRVETEDADISALVLARYLHLYFSFDAEPEGDRFTVYGDIEGTNQDLEVAGSYSATARVLRLRAPALPGTLTATYDFVGNDEMELVTEGGDAALWGILFGIDLRTTDEVRVSLRR